MAFKKHIINLILLLCMFSANGQLNIDTFGSPVFWYEKPESYTIQTGSNPPCFVLYSSGILIYKKGKLFKKVQLTPDEKLSIANDLFMEDTIFNTSLLFNTEDLNTSTLSSDLPIYQFSLRRHSTDSTATIVVYGSLNNPKYQNNYIEKLLSIHIFVTNYDRPDAVEWTPEMVQVTASAFPQSKMLPTNWPNEVPATFQEKEDLPWKTMLLEKKYFDPIKSILSNQTYNSPIKIRDKNYSLSLKYLIPGLGQ